MLLGLPRQFGTRHLIVEFGDETFDANRWLSNDRRVEKDELDAGALLHLAGENEKYPPSRTRLARASSRRLLLSALVQVR